MIARAEKPTRQRVGQIVRRTLARRGVDPAGARVRRRIAGLDASLRLAVQTIEDGELVAIDRLLRALDRRRTKAAAPASLDRRDGAAQRDAAARAAGPARASFCLQPADFAQSGEKCISKNFVSERIFRSAAAGTAACGPGGGERAGVRGR
ncbi:MAG: hypothetical protein ABSG83_05485 [Roseiarcus sp.]